MPLLEHRQLLECQRVDRAEGGQLALELLGVACVRRALGELGFTQVDQLVGPVPELPGDVLVQRLGPQVDLVELELQGAGPLAHGVEPLLGHVPVLAQLLESLATGPHGVDLVLVVVAQCLEDAVETGVLGGDQRLEGRAAPGPRPRGACGGPPSPRSSA